MIHVEDIMKETFYRVIIEILVSCEKTVVDKKLINLFHFSKQKMHRRGLVIDNFLSSTTQVFVNVCENSDQS